MQSVYPATYHIRSCTKHHWKGEQSEAKRESTALSKLSSGKDRWLAISSNRHLSEDMSWGEYGSHLWQFTPS
jgi:hypothetical protein